MGDPGWRALAEELLSATADREHARNPPAHRSLAMKPTAEERAERTMAAERRWRAAVSAVCFALLDEVET